MSGKSAPMIPGRAILTVVWCVFGVAIFALLLGGPFLLHPGSWEIRATPLKIAKVTLNGVSTRIMSDAIVRGGVELGKTVAGDDPEQCAKLCLQNTSCTGFAQSEPGVGGVSFAMCTISSGQVRIERNAQMKAGIVKSRLPKSQL